MLNAFKTRNPWATGILSVICGPVVGMFYLCRGWLGIIYYLAFVLFMVLPFIGAHFGLFTISPGELIDISIAIPGVIGVIHCIVLARKQWNPEQLKWYGRWYNVIGLLIIVPLLAVFGFRTFLYEPFHIPGDTMSPNIRKGDYLFANKFAYGYSNHSLPFNIPLFERKGTAPLPERGDIIIYAKDGTKYIKRVIGLPGETIQLRKSIVHINGKAVEVKLDRDSPIDNVEFQKKPYIQWYETLPNGVRYQIRDIKDNSKWDNTAEYHIPEGHYFVLGDNRDYSLDSRSLEKVGYIPEAQIVAKLSVIIWNADARKLQFSFLN